MATGRVVDAYSNIETVKLFAHDAQEQSYALSALRRLRLRFQRFLRLMTMLAFGMNAINGILILILVGPAIWFWIQGLRIRRRSCSNIGPCHPIERDEQLDHVGDHPAF